MALVSWREQRRGMVPFLVWFTIRLSILGLELFAYSMLVTALVVAVVGVGTLLTVGRIKQTLLGGPSWPYPGVLTMRDRFVDRIGRVTEG